MRAMMSDRTARKVDQDWGCYDGDASDYMAEQEALRILRETEPRDDTTQPHGAHPGCYDPTSRIYCAECMRPVMRAILAESLAAFIALPIE